MYIVTLTWTLKEEMHTRNKTEFMLLNKVTAEKKFFTVQQQMYEQEKMDAVLEWELTCERRELIGSCSNWNKKGWWMV